MNKTAKLAFNLLLPLLAVVAMNMLIFGLGWNDPPQSEGGWLNPPGALIGAVWVGLFVLMGVARYRVQRSGHTQARRYARLIVYYMLFCLSYPLYTLGLQSEAIGFIGNGATFAVACYLVLRIRKISYVAAWCLSPALPWILYATATML